MYKKIMLLLIFGLAGACSHMEQKQAFLLAELHSQPLKDQAYLEAQLYAYAGDMENSVRILESYLHSTQDKDEDTVSLKLMLARLYAEKEKNDEALKIYSAIEEEQPNNLQALADLARFYYGAGLKRKSFEVYTKLSERNPEASNYWIYRGLLALELGDSAAAWDSFDFLQHQSKDAKHLGHYYMGRLMELSGNVKKARKSFQSCIKIKPEEVDCVLALGESYYREGQTERAQKILRNFAEQNSAKNSQALLTKLVDWGLKANQIEKTLVDLEVLERLNPSALGVKRKILSLLIQKKDFKSAEQRLKVMMESHLVNENDVFGYIALLAKKKSYNEILNFMAGIEERKEWSEKFYFRKLSIFKEVYNSKALSKLIENCLSLRKNRATCLYVGATVLYEKQNVDEAQKHLRKALKTSSIKQENKIRYFLAEIFMKKGKDRRALREIERAVQNKYPPALNYKAYHLAQNNKKLDMAEFLVIEALAQDPQNGHYLDTYGYILYLEGKFAQSVVVLEQANKVKPGEAEIMEHLADAYGAVEDQEKALYFYKLALELYKGENQERLEGKIAQTQKQKRMLSSFSNSGPSPSD